MKDLHGRVAVVTGAASGIGYALSERFLREGMRVVMSDIDDDRLKQAATELDGGDDVLAVQADASKWEDVQALERSAIEHFGAVHVLCNNVGVISSDNTTTWDEMLEDYRWVLEVNIGSVIHGIKAFLPGMLERGEPGHVVTTASIGGILVSPGIPSYTTSKFAIVALTENLYRDLVALDALIGVSVLCAGGVVTNMRANCSALRPSGPQSYSEPGEGRVSPDEVADMVVDGIREDRFWILTHSHYGPQLEQRYRGIIDGNVAATSM